MKFELQLDAMDIQEAISDAEGEGVDELSLVIIGEVYKDKKAKITKMYLHGECVTEYMVTIQGDK